MEPVSAEAAPRRTSTTERDAGAKCAEISTELAK
jgi:hypothetical protein